MASQYVKLPKTSGGGGGTPTGLPNSFAGFDSSGNLNNIPGINVDTTSGGQSIDLTEQPDNASSSFTVNTSIVRLDPLQNSPNESWNLENFSAYIDPNQTGFNIGTTGNAITLINNYVEHHGTGDSGGISLINNSMSIGNGTDPIDVKGISYSYGFGSVAANVNLNGPLQGYGFQPNFDPASTMDSSTYVTGFYDAANLQIDLPSYTSFNASPIIGTITNNHNLTSLNANPNITELEGNAGYTGVGIYPNVAAIGTGGVIGVNIGGTVAAINSGGYYNGVSISPTITLNKSTAYGVNVNLDNVTNYAGVQSHLTVQDITITAINPGNNNNITIEYTDTTTAGNEVATFSNPHIVVSIESGVSTATQVAAALSANFVITSNFTITISGTASNPQVTQPETNLIDGENPGTKKAAYFGGDVQIQGDLSFTGALAIGAINGYAPKDLTTAISGVNSIDSIITAPFLAANQSASNVDLLGINTAMLLQIGDNATATSQFLGFAALGLPAVLSMGTGSTIDRVSGATFAISLDSSATGGTADEVDLCRSLAIPNGVTTINKLIGYKMDLPFGNPGTVTWGFYESPGVNNYMQGNLLIGGTAGSDDTVTNSNVALEIKSTTKAFVLSRMDTTARDAMTPVAGMVIFNTTVNAMQVYDGSAWV